MQQADEPSPRGGDDAGDMMAYLDAHDSIGEFSETWAGVPLQFRVALTSTPPRRNWVGSARGIVFRGSEVLIVAEGDGPGLVVGGRPEPHETLEDALVREVAEETGWTVELGPIVALIHAHNVGATVQLDWRRPDPDFIDPIYVAEAIEFSAEHRLDGSPYHFIDVGEALGLFSDVRCAILARALDVRNPASEV